MQFRNLDAKTYQHHPLHALDRAWPETNCYVDLWLELLHGLGYEPLASLPVVFETGFEGDHFTFFKQPPEVLRALYGMTVQETAVWRPLEHHVVEQLTFGRPVLIEFDSFYLPDTVGVAYRANHTKSTVAALSIDIEAKRLGYFHNRGYHLLQGDDFDGVFRLAPGLKGNPDLLPPYCEVVKLSPQTALKGPALVEGSLTVLREHLRRRPPINPVATYRPRLAQDVAWLITEPMETYHLYVFNTLRQLGASYELGQSYFQWLTANGVEGLAEATAACGAVSDGCKAVLMVLARAVTRKKLPDLKPSMDAIETAWDTVFRTLPARITG